MEFLKLEANLRLLKIKWFIQETLVNGVRLSFPLVLLVSCRVSPLWFFHLFFSLDYFFYFFALSIVSWCSVLISSSLCKCNFSLPFLYKHPLLSLTSVFLSHCSSYDFISCPCFLSISSFLISEDFSMNGLLS